MADSNKRIAANPTSQPRTIRTDQAPKEDSKTILVVENDETKHFQVVTKKPSPAWLKSLYDINLVTVDELAGIYDSIRYIGFNRELMLYKLEQMTGDSKLALQLILACALRGPQAASKLKMRNGKTPSEMGITGSGKMGTEELSCQRIASSTADLAAFYMKILNVPKRIPDSDCPAWLQFPTAGSIRMPDDMRKLHIEFSKRFSTLIGGIFREDIYGQMVANSYLDENLNLF